MLTWKSAKDAINAGAGSELISDKDLRVFTDEHREYAAIAKEAHLRDSLKNKIILLVTSVSIVALIVVSAFLYNVLRSNEALRYETGSLSVIERGIVAGDYVTMSGAEINSLALRCGMERDSNDNASFLFKSRNSIQVIKIDIVGDVVKAITQQTIYTSSANRELYSDINYILSRFSSVCLTHDEIEYLVNGGNSVEKVVGKYKLSLVVRDEASTSETQRAIKEGTHLIELLVSLT